MIWVRWCLLKSIMKKKFKNGISLITIPVPIVCVFQGCVISSCWYFAQALLRILITACLISLFFLALIERYDPLEIAAAMFFISATERPWEGIWNDYFFGGEKRGGRGSGRKNVLPKLLRIPYRRLKAGFFDCVCSEWSARGANVCSL